MSFQIFFSFLLILILQVVQVKSHQSDVTELDDTNFRSVVLNSNELWMVAFINPGCPHCQRLHPTWEKLATKLAAVGIRVGRVNVQNARRTAQPYNIQGVPTIKLFPAGKTGSQKKPVDYNRGRDLKSLAMFAVQHLPKNAKYISDSDFEAVLSGKPHLVLVTNKHKVPHLFAGLCLTFSNDMNCAWSRDTQSQVLEHFGLSKDQLPGIFYWDGSNYQKYSGKAHFDDIADWVDGILDPEPESSGSSSQQQQSSTTENTKPKKQKFTVDPFDFRKCRDQPICIVPILGSMEAAAIRLSEIENVANYWDSEKRYVGWLSPRSDTTVNIITQIFGNVQTFPWEPSDLTELFGWVLIRPRKGKISFCPAEQDPIELITNGQVRWTKVDKSYDFMQ